MKMRQVAFSRQAPSTRRVRDSWLTFDNQCVTMNNWSHAMYFFSAGASQIELYRKLKQMDPNQAVCYSKGYWCYFDVLMKFRLCTPSAPRNT